MASSIHELQVSCGFPLEVTPNLNPNQVFIAKIKEFCAAALGEHRSFCFLAWDPAKAGENPPLRSPDDIPDTLAQLTPYLSKKIVKPETPKVVYPDLRTGADIDPIIFCSGDGTSLGYFFSKEYQVSTGSGNSRL